MYVSKTIATAAIAAAFAVLMWALPASSEPLTVVHAQGETTLAARPKVVFTLDFSPLETLDVLGVDVAGVPGSLLPPHLSKYADAKYTKIGTLFEPDYEAINAAKPDLIIVAARSAPKLKELSRIAPTIDLTVDETDFLASVFRRARTIGEIFGKQSEIEARIAKIESDAKALREKAPAAGRALIILTTGGRMSAYGPRSRFGLLHTAFGITPAVPDLDRAVHGQGVSFELILKADPDWLFVVDRDTAIGRPGQPAAKLLDNPLVARTKAWKNGHVTYLDPVRWYLVGGGIASVQANLDQIARALPVKP